MFIVFVGSPKICRYNTLSLIQKLIIYFLCMLLSTVAYVPFFSTSPEDPAKHGNIATSTSCNSILFFCLLSAYLMVWFSFIVHGTSLGNPHYQPFVRVCKRELLTILFADRWFCTTNLWSLPSLFSYFLLYLLLHSKIDWGLMYYFATHCACVSMYLST